MKEKQSKLTAILGEMGSLIVAYSGGVDSTYLAVMAHGVLGAKALAVTAVSPSLAQREREQAVALAERFGLHHRLLATDETSNPSYLANNTNRCYFCKDELFTRLGELAVQEGYCWVADGFNADDLKDFRPGHKAGQKHGARSPLFEAGLTKEEIRALSQERGLPTWDKPAIACLSSRFPYGTPIDLEALGRIDAAEAFVQDLGFRQVRVRHHGAVARIEVEANEISRLAQDEVRHGIVQKLRSLGYLYVTVDLAGYRTGSLNEAVPHLPRKLKNA